MIRKKGIAMGITCYLLMLTSIVAQNSLNIVFVNMESVFQDYYKTVIAEEMIKKQTEIYREYAENLRKELEVLQNDFNSLRDLSQNIALSEEVREEKRGEAQTKLILLQEKEKEVQAYQKEKRMGIRKQYEEERNKLVKEITVFVKQIAEREDYDLVADSSGTTFNGIATFIYHRESMDITDRIITELNRGHEKEGKKTIR